MRRELPLTIPKGVVLDFGNVLYHVNYPAMARTLAGDRAEAFLARFTGSVLLTGYEAGRLGLEDVLAGLESSGYPMTRERFLEGYLSIFSPVEGMAALVERLAGAVPLALLSNTSPEHAAHFIERVPEFQHFRSRVYSFEVGLMKPAPQLYREAAARLSLPTAELVYVDDLLANVEGARAVGMTAIHFVDAPALAWELGRLGLCA